MQNIVTEFLVRHCNIMNLFLHMIGIPLTIIGIVQLFYKKWKAGILLFVLGYLFQWAGHTFLEQNQMGEIALIMNIINKIRGV
jgi:Protein of unknown function (DUF962).